MVKVDQWLSDKMNKLQANKSEFEKYEKNALFLKSKNIYIAKKNIF